MVFLLEPKQPEVPGAVEKVAHERQEGGQVEEEREEQEEKVEEEEEQEQEQEG